MTQRSYTAWADQARRESGVPTIGKLGYWVDGAFTVVVAGDLGRYWVRFGDQSYAAFPHKGRVGVPADLTSYNGQNVSVEVGIDQSGEMAILGLWSSEVNAQLQGDPNLLVQPHTHPMEQIIEFEPLTDEGFVYWVDETTLETRQAIATRQLDLSDPPTPAELDAEFPSAVDGFAFQNNDNGTGDDFQLFIRQDSTWARYQALIVLDAPVLTPAAGYYPELPEWEWSDP